MGSKIPLNNLSQNDDFEKPCCSSRCLAETKLPCCQSQESVESNSTGYGSNMDSPLQEEANAEERMFCLEKPDSNKTFVTINKSILINSRFLELVASGLFEEVDDLLKDPHNDKSLDKNYVNKNRNQNALRIAIENKDAKMCEVLLNHKVEVMDNLFHAVNNNFIEGVKLILEKRDCGEIGDEIFCIEANHQHSFCAEMTPIALAAHKNLYEIVKLLHENGCKITPINKLDFKKSKEVVEEASRNMIMAEANASPAYISFKSSTNDKDALTYCIELIEGLKKIASVEHELLEFYTNLQCKVEKYMCSLLDQVHSSKELAHLFKYDDNKESNQTTAGTNSQKTTKNNLVKCVTHQKEQVVRYFNKDKSKKMKILEEACKIRLVDFVTHPKSQLGVAAQRVPYFSWMNQTTLTRKYLEEGFMGLLFPFWSIFHILFPTTNWGKAICHPTVSYAGHLMSDIAFIALLIVSAFLKSPETDYLGAPPTIVEWLIFVWVIGKLQKEAFEFVCRGWKNYLTDWWNYNDLFQLSLFLAVIVCRILDYLRHGESEERVTRGSWPPFEPRTIGTGCFAIAYIFVFLQILNLMRVSQTFGPLQLSLAKMLINVVQFLCIFGLVLFAFGLALTELYSYYGTAEGSKKLCKLLQNGTLGKCKEAKIRHMGDSLLALFWTLFGHTDVETLSLKGKQPFIEGVGFALIGIYHVAAIIILVNMLIAMMAKSFDMTSIHRDEEWKFYRTVVWIQFIRKETTIPPPMNLIPNPWQIIRLIKVCFQKLTRKRSGYVQPDGKSANSDSVGNNREWKTQSDNCRNSANSINVNPKMEQKSELKKNKSTVVHVENGTAEKNPCEKAQQERKNLSVASGTDEEGDVDKTPQPKTPLTCEQNIESTLVKRYIWSNF